MEKTDEQVVSDEVLMDELAKVDWAKVAAGLGLAMELVSEKMEELTRAIQALEGECRQRLDWFESDPKNRAERRIYERKGALGLTLYREKQQEEQYRRLVK